MSNFSKAIPCFLCDKSTLPEEIFCRDCQKAIDEYYRDFSIVVIGNEWQNELEADYRAEQDQARMPL